MQDNYKHKTQCPEDLRILISETRVVSKKILNNMIYGGK